MQKKNKKSKFLATTMAQVEGAAARWPVRRVDARPGMEYEDGNVDYDWAAVEGAGGHPTEFSTRSPAKSSIELYAATSSDSAEPEDKLEGISFLGMLEVFVEYTGATAAGVDAEALHRGGVEYGGVAQLVEVHEKMVKDTAPSEPRGDHYEHDSSSEEEKEAGVSVVGLLDNFMSMFHTRERERELEEVHI